MKRGADFASPIDFEPQEITSRILGGWVTSQDGRSRGFHNHGDRVRPLRIGLWDLQMAELYGL